MAVHAFLSQRMTCIPLVGWFAVAGCLLTLIGLVVFVGGIREMREHKSYHFAEAYASDGSVVKSHAITMSSAAGAIHSLTFAVRCLGPETTQTGNTTGSSSMTIWLKSDTRMSCGDD